MTDTKLLEAKINDSGLKRSHLASRLGLSSYGLQRKIQGKSEFKTGEVQALCKELAINSEEMTLIFFAER
jgi:hypothetical protein